MRSLHRRLSSLTFPAPALPSAAGMRTVLPCPLCCPRCPSLRLPWPSSLLPSPLPTPFSSHCRPFTSLPSASPSHAVPTPAIASASPVASDSSFSSNLYPPPPPRSPPPPSSAWVRALTWLSLLPVLFALDDGVVSLATVHGASMQPTLNPSPTASSHSPAFSSPTPSSSPASRDVVLLWKLSSSSLSSYPHGSIVVLRSASNERRQLIKRLVAKEGDWLLTPATASTLSPALPSASSELSDESVELIGKGRVWVEGDNRGKSVEDSREYGQYPAALLQGRVVAVVWPPHRLQWLPNTLDPVGGRERLVNRHALVL